MTKHELIYGAPLALKRVMESEFRTDEQKLEFIAFLEDSLSRAAHALEPEDCDLPQPLADLFGALGEAGRGLRRDDDDDAPNS